MGFKDQQQKHWDLVAPGWEAWADWTDRNFRPITEWLVSATALGTAARVLDVGSGAGYPALPLAASIGAAGRVVAVDASPAMTAVVSRRARAHGLANVDVHVMDAERLQFPDASFDVVVNTYGLMFCEDPGLAVREALRVLAPGGRLAVVVWDDRARSPFFTVIGDVAARLLSMTPPDPSAPGSPWRFAPRGVLESLLAEAGFTDVRVESRTITCAWGSADEYVRTFADVAWKPRMSALSPPERSAFVEAVGAAAAPYMDGGRLRLDAVSHCAIGRRPA